MRDPKRIDEFCARLAEAWKNVPDWRFGQVIENFKRASKHPDLFYIEDEQMAEEIESYLRGY